MKFQIPFELMVVFSTNLEPSDLADEAFLRRIHNKIYVEAVDAHQFDQIFGRVVQARNIQAGARQRRIPAQAVPARRPHGIARLLSGRYLQHPAVHRPL